MVVNDRIAELIRESRADEIPSAIRDGSYYDMQTLTQALIDLALAGLVDRETATNAAPNAHDFQIALDHAEKARAAERPSTTASGRHADTPPRQRPVRPRTRHRALRLGPLPAGALDLAEGPRAGHRGSTEP